jgi:hypothetical protein
VEMKAGSLTRISVVREATFLRVRVNYLLEINILSNPRHKTHSINGKETVKRQASDLHEIDCQYFYIKPLPISPFSLIIAPKGIYNTRYLREMFR